MVRGPGPRMRQVQYGHAVVTPMRVRLCVQQFFRVFVQMLEAPNISLSLFPLHFSPKATTQAADGGNPRSLVQRPYPVARAAICTSRSYLEF